MDDLDELTLTPEAARLVARAVRKAYRQGYAAAAGKFDALLERMHRLKELNGSTELFKHQWREDLHPRDKGKFSTKEGEGKDESAVGGGGGERGGGGGRLPVPVGGEEAPGGVAEKPGTDDGGHPPADYLLDGLHADVPAGLWGTVRDKVLTAAAGVYERLVLATPAFLKLQDLFTTLGDHPSDLSRFGYKPSISGVAGHDTPDAFREATGVSGTLGARLAAHVLAKTISWIRTQAGLGKAVDASDPYLEAGQALADALAVLAEAFGLEGDLPTGEEVGLALVAMEEGATVEKAGKFSCAMVSLAGRVVGQLENMQRQIRDEDLGEDGRETDYHVTVRYGLHTDDAEDVRPVVEGFGEVSMAFGRPAFFAGADSGKDYDVIILPVDSPDLVRLHAALGELPHTDTHAEYKPHATVAYVKAGLAADIVAEMGYPRTTMRETVREVLFSNRNKEQTVISLETDAAAGADTESGENPEAKALPAAPASDPPGDGTPADHRLEPPGSV